MDCPNDRYVNDAAICQAVVGMLARIGVKVNLLAQPKAQYFAKVLNTGNYQTSFYLLGWTPGTSDAHNVLYEIMGCRDDPKSSRGQANLGGYCNKKLDELTEKILVEGDVGKARPDDQAGLRDGGQGFRLHPPAPAGSRVGRFEKGQAQAARRQRRSCSTGPPNRTRRLVNRRSRRRPRFRDHSFPG